MAHINYAPQIGTWMLSTKHLCEKQSRLKCSRMCDLWMPSLFLLNIYSWPSVRCLPGLSGYKCDRSHHEDCGSMSLNVLQAACTYVCVFPTRSSLLIIRWRFCSLFMWEGIHGQQSGHVTEWRAEEREGRGDVFSDVRGGGVVKTGSVGQWVTGPGAPLVLLSSAVSLTPSLITGRRHVMTSAQAVKGKCYCSFTWPNDLNSVFD